MFKKTLSLTVIFCFFLTILGPLPQAHADTFLGLPQPGTMVSISPNFEPALIKGLTVHKDNPFLFDFIVDPGQSQVSQEELKEESDRMIKYFFASLTIPDKDIWVNLSPYEKDRMIPQSLGETAMGRDLLAQDYMLKQLTASLIYPQNALGKTFWTRVYAKAKEMYGTTQIPVNTFNKVWIVPQRAGIYEHGQTAFIVDGHLKVMLEEDYLSLKKHAVGAQFIAPTKGDSMNRTPTNKVNTLGSQIIRQIILPEIEKEVNEDKNFSTPRQIFYAQVLAVWFKRNLKQALLNRVYANKNTVKGIDQNNPATNEAIYQQYLRAYKKGVFNYIKEDKIPNSFDPSTGDQQIIARKYFSGGYATGVIDIKSLAMLTPKAIISASRSVIISVFAASQRMKAALLANLSPAFTNMAIMKKQVFATTVALWTVALNGMAGQIIEEPTFVLNSNGQQIQAATEAIRSEFKKSEAKEYITGLAWAFGTLAAGGLAALGASRYVYGKNGQEAASGDAAEDRAMLIEALQWFHTSEPLLNIQRYGILGMTGAVVISHIIFNLAKKSKSLKTKRMLYRLFKIDALHIASAVATALPALSLIQKDGGNLGQYGILATVAAKGAGGKKGFGPLATDLFNMANQVKSVDDERLVALENFAGNELRRQCFISDWPLLVQLTALSYFAPVPEIWNRAKFLDYLTLKGLVFKLLLPAATIAVSIKTGAGIANKERGIQAKIEKLKVVENVNAVLKKVLNIESKQIFPKARIFSFRNKRDGAFTGKDLMNIQLGLQNKFKTLIIPFEDAQKWKTIGDIYNYIQAKIDSAMNTIQEIEDRGPAVFAYYQGQQIMATEILSQFASHEEALGGGLIEFGQYVPANDFDPELIGVSRQEPDGTNRYVLQMNVEGFIYFLIELKQKSEGSFQRFASLLPVHSGLGSLVQNTDLFSPGSNEALTERVLLHGDVVSNVARYQRYQLNKNEVVQRTKVGKPRLMDEDFHTIDDIEMIPEGKYLYHEIRYDSYDIDVVLVPDQAMTAARKDRKRIYQLKELERKVRGGIASRPDRVLQPPAAITSQRGWMALNLRKGGRMPTRDQAALAIQPVGGIDLSQQDSAMHITKDADGGVKVDVDPALIARVERDGMPEIDPVIIGTRPADISTLFGVKVLTSTP